MVDTDIVNGHEYTAAITAFGLKLKIRQYSRVQNTVESGNSKLGFVTNFVY